MASSRPAPARPAQPPRSGPAGRAILQRRRRRRLAAIALLAVLGALAWFWPALHDKAVAGASYGARVGCACRFIAGRELGDCRKDFVSGMGMVMLAEDAEAKSVTATVPLLSRQKAIFRAGQGCVSEPWRD